MFLAKFVGTCLEFEFEVCIKAGLEPSRKCPLQPDQNDVGMFGPFSVWPVGESTRVGTIFVGI